MSAILGLFSFGAAAAPSEALVERLLGRMHARASGPAGIWREGGAALAVARHDWEMGPGFSGPVLVVQDAELVVAADASLYYRDDLRRKLAEAGIRPQGQTASHLILAAYRAWGPQLAEALEGDYAFLLYDRTARRVVAARDFSGRRSLYYAELPGDLLVVATTQAAVAAHPDCPRDLDLRVIAEATAAFVADDSSSCFRAISRVRARHTIVREQGASLAHFPHWEPPVFERDSGVPFDEAALELQAILQRATAERLSQVGNTAVWMSGGRDSTAVFAVAQKHLREHGGDASVFPVSISYPEGDPGREDEYIAAVAEHWDVPVQWLDVYDIPLFDRVAERGGDRDEAFAHLYEMVNRTLARRSLAGGAHVAFDGVGGDQLFLISYVFMSDLLRGGKWGKLAHEWRSAGFAGAGFRTFFRWAIQPGLSDPLLNAARFVRRGRPLRAEMRRRTPLWVAPTFQKMHGIEEWERMLPHRRRGESVSASESRWMLTEPFFQTVLGQMGTFALEENVEIRSPFYDLRLIDFAAARPREERLTGTDNKRLLRASMKGLIPDWVLAPRTHRTGTSGSYFASAMQAQFPALIADVLQRSRLVELGVIDARKIEKARDRYLRTLDQELGLRLFLTLQAELWVRAQEMEFTMASAAAVRPDVHELTVVA